MRAEHLPPLNAEHEQLLFKIMSDSHRLNEAAEKESAHNRGYSTSKNESLQKQIEQDYESGA